MKASRSFQPLDRAKWDARMPLPSNEQVGAHKTSLRSPYLVCWPMFPGTTGYYAYAVDFKADSQPRGTYLSIGSWHMDMSDLQGRYGNVSGGNGLQPGGGYAGFQVLDDGSKVAIMSIWNIYATDANGNTAVIRANRTYPANPRIGNDFDGEGVGARTIVDYDWQAGRTYRALIQCGQTDAGNCELLFYVCDLTTGRWDKLVAYDLGYGNTCITATASFLENFLTDHAGEIRTVEWRNFRANSREVGAWVSATSAVMQRQFDAWPGSYNYGSDGSCFWAIATGIPGLCEAPANSMECSVSNALVSSPV